MLNAKKIMSIILLLPIFSLGISSTVAEYANNNYLNTANNGYKEAVIDSNIIKFEAKRDSQIVYMEWTNYNKEDFMYYKIMRSETHSNPVYPNQPAIKFLDNNDVTEFKFNDYSSKDTVYRICVITKEKARYCSNTVKIEGFDHSEYKKEYEAKKEEYKKNYETKKADYEAKKIEYKEKYENKKLEHKEKVQKIKSRLSEKMQNKANLAAKKFIQRIEKKYESNEERIEKFEKVISKLEALKNKNNKYEDLVNHLNMKFKERIESYEEDFNEIDKIFSEIE